MKNNELIQQRNALLVILWGLLFTKCFVLEFLVQHYAIPINSVAYIWSLSIFMATVATVVYLKLRIEENPQSTHFPPQIGIWAAGLIGMLMVIGGAFSIESLSVWQIPALLAVLLGFAYCAQGLLVKQLIDVFSGFGWWLGSALLFRSEPPVSLLCFALLIVLFTILPTFVQFINRRRSHV